MDHRYRKVVCTYGDACIAAAVRYEKLYCYSTLHFTFSRCIEPFCYSIILEEKKDREEEEAKRKERIEKEEEKEEKEEEKEKEKKDEENVETPV